MFKNKLDKIDANKVNETLTLTNKILKISLILVVALGTYIIIAILKQLKILEVIGKIVGLLISLRLSINSIHHYAV